MKSLNKIGYLIPIILGMLSCQRDRIDDYNLSDNWKLNYKALMRGAFAPVPDVYDQNQKSTFGYIIIGNDTIEQVSLVNELLLDELPVTLKNHAILYLDFDTLKNKGMSNGAENLKGGMYGDDRYNYLEIKHDSILDLQNFTIALWFNSELIKPYDPYVPGSEDQILLSKRNEICGYDLSFCNMSGKESDRGAYTKANSDSVEFVFEPFCRKISVSFNVNNNMGIVDFTSHISQTMSQSMGYYVNFPYNDNDETTTDVFNGIIYWPGVIIDDTIKNGTRVDTLCGTAIAPRDLYPGDTLRLKVIQTHDPDDVSKDIWWRVYDKWPKKFYKYGVDETLSDGNWHFLFITVKTGNEMEIYLSIDNDKYTDHAVLPIENIKNNGSLYLGGINTGIFDSNKFFFGSLDNVMIFDKVLTKEEEFELYNSRIE